MKSFSVPFILSAVLLYTLKEFTSGFSNRDLVPNLLFATNIISLTCLNITSIYSIYIKHLSMRSILLQEEDALLLTLERISYSAIIWIQISLSLSFVTLLVGFLLIRDSHPFIVFHSILLFIIAFVSLVLGTYLLRYMQPEFKPSDTFNQDLFSSYNDEKKSVMLKSLYKLYFWMIALLVLLAFGLMIYSAFTTNTQIVSIIGIGVILLFVQLYYSTSLKSK